MRCHLRKSQHFERKTNTTSSGKFCTFMQVSFFSFLPERLTIDWFYLNFCSKSGFRDFLFSNCSLQICLISFKLEHFLRELNSAFWLNQYWLSHFCSVRILGWMIGDYILRCALATMLHSMDSMPSCSQTQHFALKLKSSSDNRILVSCKIIFHAFVTIYHSYHSSKISH